MPYTCQRFPDVEAIVRLLIEPPVEVRWPTFVQRLEVVSNPCPGYPPYGEITLTRPDRGHLSEHYDSGGHAYHVIKQGFRFRIPSLYAKFFAELVREGRAEYVWGPHIAIHWHPILPEKTPLWEADARYTYKRAHDFPEEDVAPIRA